MAPPTHNTGIGDLAPVPPGIIRPKLPQIVIVGGATARRINTSRNFKPSPQSGARPLAKIPQPLHHADQLGFPGECLSCRRRAAGWVRAGDTARQRHGARRRNACDLGTRQRLDQRLNSRTAPRSPSISAIRNCVSPACCRRAASRGFYGTAKVHKSGPMYDKIWTPADSAGKRSRSGQEGLGGFDQGRSRGRSLRQAARYQVIVALHHQRLNLLRCNVPTASDSRGRYVLLHCVAVPA